MTAPATPPPVNGQPIPSSVRAPLRALLRGLVDYAGLFPPAKLAMRPAVENYAKYLDSGHHWMLGRFICPVSRLEEFRSEAKGLMPGLDDVVEVAVADETDELITGPRRGGTTPADEPFPGWRLSAIIDGDLDENLDAIFAFNHEHSRAENGLAMIDAIELKAASATAIDEALDLVPDELFPFFELPVAEGADIRGFLTALAGSEAGAKIRTGGVTPEAFPSPRAVAEFIAGCHAADVPFKATAGLHHPIRAEHNLTYEPESPRGVMHGFLNVFLAAAFVRTRKLDVDGATTLLEERDAASIEVTDEGIRWRTHALAPYEIEQTRREFALSYGSCSFEEPVQDLRGLGLLGS